LQAMFALDPFSIFFKLLFIGAIGILAMLSEDFLAESRYSPWEYYSLLAFALCGMMFMASGVHLITIYIGLELLSLSSYILAGFYKSELKSTEAAMKYFILGAVSSGILLYGISLIYGVCGSLNLLDIAAAMSTIVTNDALMFGIMLLGAGLCFKIAAVPFHVWTPDVYEGSPTPVAAFFSVGPKVAAYAILARIFYVAFPKFHADWGLVVALVAAATMILGNVAALLQTNVKRLLAYSSIANAGYALLGVLGFSTEWGLWGVLVYLLAYTFMNFGAFTLVILLETKGYAGESVSDFNGLAQRNMPAAMVMLLFLLSLAGIPPTAGFIGKYYLFTAAMKAGYAWLAVLAVVMSAVSLFYYFRIASAMFFSEAAGAKLQSSYALNAVVLICAVGTLVIGVAPQPFLAVLKSCVLQP